MRLSARLQLLINGLLIAISIAIWGVLLFDLGGSMGMKHCAVSSQGPSAASLEMLLAMNPVSDQLIGWGLMVLAMMLPKLSLPIQQIVAQSLKRMRLISTVLFVLGYLVTWMVAGLIVLGITFCLNLLLPLSYLPAIGALAVALIWQFSPWKQHFLNLGHNHRILAAFGWQAWRDAFLYGTIHGLWCVGAGWALMLFPMLLPKGHNAAMILVTFVMLSEHLEHPQVAKWRFDLRFRLFRYLIAQTSIRLQSL